MSLTPDPDATQELTQVTARLPVPEPPNPAGEAPSGGRWRPGAPSSPASPSPSARRGRGRAKRRGQGQSGDGAKSQPGGRRARRRQSKSKDLAKRRMPFRDVVATAVLGPRTRLVRTALSALGIAIGIAALVALQGIPASARAQIQAEMDAQGANLLVVYPGQEDGMWGQGSDIPLPETAPAMIARIGPVEGVLTRRDLQDVGVYRSDLIPANQSGAISAALADGDLLTTLGVTMAEGKWFDQAARELPTVVLGDGAARRLRAGVGQRIWVADRWWAVIGVLERMELAEEMDSTAFLAPAYADQFFPDTPIASIYVASAQGQTSAVRRVLAATANPADPKGVSVTKLSEFFQAGEMMDQMFRTLSLGLGALALLIGGIGIANTMVVAVMERRGEVGLRRAMGARAGQIALQFVLEAALIGFIGGVFGVGVGAYATYVYTAAGHTAYAMPWWVIAAGPAISIAIGALAGLYPSLKAARLSPTVALRAV